MNASGLPSPPKPWPPLRIAKLPPWIKFRDLALTLIAWAVLAWLLRDLVHLIYDFLSHPIFELTTALPPDLALIWSRLQIMVALSVLMVAALLAWAVKERHRLRARNPILAPSVLTLEEQAAWFRVDANMVAAARNFKITDIHFYPDGTIRALDGREAPSPEL